MTVTMGFIGFGKSANRYHLPYITIREPAGEEDF